MKYQFTLKTSIELPIAHRLSSAYSGLCVGNVGTDGKSIEGTPVYHGHNYYVTISVISHSINKDCMVADFKLVKKIIHEYFDQYDHSFILKKGDPLLEFYNNNSSNTRLFVWDCNPTAEYMSLLWMQEMKKRLSEIIPDVKVKICVEETKNNSVTCEEVEE